MYNTQMDWMLTNEYVGELDIAMQLIMKHNKLTLEFN